MPWNWSGVKSDATEVCQYSGVTYYRWKKNPKWWFGKDTAHHGPAGDGSEYKAYEDRGDKIVLQYSVDKEGQFMTDKHESRRGYAIKKKDMKVVKGPSKGKK